MFTALKHAVARARAFFLARDLDRDLEQELDSHVTMLTEDNVRRGMTTDEARRAALIRVGARASIREQHRELRGLPWLEAVLQDVRHALRGMAKAPGFTIVAVVTLALGIGANTAIFTLVDQALLRLLPVHDPRALVLVSTVGPHHGATWGDGNSMSHPLYAELRDRNDVFTGMFARLSRRVA